jgi:hypothetical protein
MDDSVIVEVPRPKRLRKALITLAVTVGVSVWAVAYLYSEGQLGLETLWLTPFFTTGMFLSYRHWSTSHVTEVTQKAQRRKREEEEAQRRRQEEAEDKWYFRYPLAALCLWGAWHFSETKPDKWWLAGIAVLAAAAFAREVSLLLLGIGLISLVFQGIASLPVSVAVLIGAVIIASAIRK